MTMTTRQPELATLTRADLTIRPARPEDRAAIEAIAAQVWDGHDYLPERFDSWLADPDGLFCVAVLGGQVVGTAKLTRLATDRWWMEGLRVDPAARRQGIARILHHYLVHQARQYAPGVLGYSTASDNLAVERLAAETGFRVVARFAPYGATALDEPLGALKPLAAADTEAVWALLSESAYFQRAQQSLEYRWRFIPLTLAGLRDRLADGTGYGWYNGQCGDLLCGVALLNEPRQRVNDAGQTESLLYAGLMAALPGQWLPLALSLRRLAAAQGYDRVSFKVLADDDQMGALEAAGYERRWDRFVYYYQRNLSLIDEE